MLKEAGIFLGVVSSDQLSKLVARNVDIASLNRVGVLGLNSFVDWGLLGGALVLVLLWELLRQKNQSYRLALVIILAAGISNLADRVMFGGVWDWVGYPVVGIKGNLADIWLFIGAFAVLGDGVFGRRNVEASYD